MKCPKCAYLGFETSDRCKNCGYDFSLADPGAFTTAADGIEIPRPDADGPFDIPLRQIEPARRATPTPIPTQPAAMPLFVPEDGDDTPLITVPARPRPPLSVRRTPDTPRLRALPKEATEPVFDFRDDAPAPAEAPSAPAAATVTGTERVARRRIAAAALNHALLLVVDAIVLYLTMRMAGLTLPELRLIPVVPFTLFLLLLKSAYLTGFTASGGQTIGKMAMQVMVVGDDFTMIDLHGALARSAASLVSYVTLGVAYLPALVGRDRRALHNRLAHTRVVALPGA